MFFCYFPAGFLPLRPLRETSVSRKISFLFAYIKNISYLCSRKGLNTVFMARKTNILSQIKQLGKQVLPQGSHLLLYGSRARGDNRADSDWDLLVLLNRPQKEDSDFATISYPLMELGFNLGQYFSVHTYSQQEWQNMSFLPFYKNVERDKIQLV